MDTDAKSDDKNYDNCIICGRWGYLRRGLCSAHYQAFNRRQRKLTPEGREKLEDRLMAEGKLRPSKQGERPDKNQEFGQVLRDLVSANPDLLKLDNRKLHNDPSPEKVVEKARRKKKKPE